MIHIEKILSEPQVKHILDFYDFSSFTDGKRTGSRAKCIKNNLEINDIEHGNNLNKFVMDILYSSTFHDDLLVKEISDILFLKYDEGMHYDFHTDAAVMISRKRGSIPKKIISHYSISCFLSDPSEYDGGELEIVVGDSSLLYKLKPGEMIIYPTGLKHRVLPVTRGSRKVFVAWAESIVPDAYIREDLLNFYKVVGDVNSSGYVDEETNTIKYNFTSEHMCMLQNFYMNMVRRYANGL